MPTRIQRKRTRGWRLPPGAICVTRPGKYGNPFRITPDRPAKDAVIAFAVWLDTMDAAEREAYLAPLRGHDLACWCRLSAPGKVVWCHGDILIEQANR